MNPDDAIFNFAVVTKAFMYVHAFHCSNTQAVL